MSNATFPKIFPSNGEESLVLGLGREVHLWCFASVNEENVG